MELQPRLVTVGKYLLHGILLQFLTSVFSSVIVVGMLGALLVGAMFGGIAGFILILGVTFVLLGAAIGYANTLVTRGLWFPTKKGFGAALGQGILLFILLLLVNIPGLLLLLFIAVETGGTAVLWTAWILVNAGGTFLAGYLGRYVAERWRTGGMRRAAPALATQESPLRDLKEDNPSRLPCPRCGSTRLIVVPDRSAFCLECQKGIHSTLWARQPQ